MFFLNLTLGEFFLLLGTLGGLITALYLLDRRKRKKVVSTLRFWTPAITAEQRQSRRRMREPWSLVLQLLSLLCLLLAIAQLQWGNRHRARDHVLLLDTSSWAGERTADGTLLDREKTVARRYLAALPAQDRVLLARVDALVTPVTGFTSDRAQLLPALSASHSGFSALNMEQALSFARQAQSWYPGRPGEIVYVGPGLISERDPAAPNLPNLRAILVQSSRNNCGIQRMEVKRSEEDLNSWQATVILKNYASHPRRVRLKTQFAGTAFAPRAFTLAPGEQAAAQYNFATRVPGRLSAEITPDDNLPGDNRAALDLPRIGMLKVVAFTARPEVLRPLLDANHRLSVKFFEPSQYQPEPGADVVLLDHVTVRQPPKAPTLWIDPPTAASPLPLKTLVRDAVIKNWHSETPLGTGLHAKGTHVESAEVFETFEGDVPVASVPEGPIVVARPSGETHAKFAVIGFDPLGGQLRFQVTTPLLFANLLAWLAPDVFRTIEITAGHVGAATIALDPSETPDRIRISTTEPRAWVPSGPSAMGLSSVPFTVQHHTLQIFAIEPSVIHILSGARERLLSLTLPELAEFEWKPPANAAAGLPPTTNSTRMAIDLWKFLAALGGFGLLFEWILFGRTRVLKSRKYSPAPISNQAPQRETELISR